jgi:hypothetical protein
MRRTVKIACMLGIAGLLVYRAAVTPEVTAGNAVRSLDHIVHAELNTDGTPAMEGVVESSVTFLANISMQKILDNMFKPGTLSQISPEHVKVVKVERAEETADAIIYKVEEEITPFNVPFVKMSPTKVYLVFTVSKRALADRTVYVKFDLDPQKQSGWMHLAGRIYAVDLHNGSTMVMVSSSTKSRFGMPNTIRLKLAKMYLEKSKDQILRWLTSINS